MILQACAVPVSLAITLLALGVPTPQHLELAQAKQVHSLKGGVFGDDRLVWALKSALKHSFSAHQNALSMVLTLGNASVECLPVSAEDVAAHLHAPCLSLRIYRNDEYRSRIWHICAAAPHLCGPVAQLQELLRVVQQTMGGVDFASRLSLNGNLV